MEKTRWHRRRIRRELPLQRACGLFRQAADPTARRFLVLSLAFVLASSLLTALAPAILKVIVDRLAPNGAAGMPLALVLLLACYGTSQWLARGSTSLQTFTHTVAEQRMLRRLSRRLFDHVLSLPMRFHSERRTGAITQTLNNAILGTRQILQHSLYSVLPVCVELPVMAFVLLYFGHPLFLVILTLAATAYTGAFLLGVRWMAEPARLASDAAIGAGAVITDSLLNLETIKAFGCERLLTDRYDRALGQSEQAWRRLYRRRAANGLLVATIMAATLCASLVLAAQAVSAGRMTVGDFVLVNGYVLQLIRPMEMLGFALRDIAQGFVFIDRMIALLQEEPEPYSSLRSAGKRAPPAIAFEDVSFAYRSGLPVLVQVSFEVPAGRRLAVVGPTGAGKSTLARLLLRFYEPDNGRVLLDGVPIAGMALADLRSRIAVVPQETPLFDDTIAANIGYGAPGSARWLIEQAAYRAGLRKFIASLPDGLDARVGEHGIRLSGGERQRIALARALLSQPALWILDEATSALDSRTEHEILGNLPELTNGATVLMITHRLSAARHADEIIVLDHGCVVERGTHGALLAAGGHYRALWCAQHGPPRDVHDLASGTGQDHAQE